MTLRLLVPIDVTAGMIAATSVDEVSNWVSGATYAKGDEVESADTHRRYRSVASGNTGNDPEEVGSVHWQDIGASNRFRAFDRAIGQSVERAESISYTIDVIERVTAVGLIGVPGGSVRIRLQDKFSGDVIEDHTREIVNTDPVQDWLTYFEWEPEAQDVVVFYDLKGFAGNQVVIDIVAPNATAQVGQICLGQAKVIGEVVGGGEIGYQSFSTVSTDDLGVTSITKRASADLMVAHVFVPIPSGARPEARLRRLVRSTDAVPTLFFDEDLYDAGIVAFGNLEEASIPLTQAGGAIFSLDVRGIL